MMMLRSSFLAVILTVWLTSVTGAQAQVVAPVAPAEVGVDAAQTSPQASVSDPATETVSVPMTAPQTVDSDEEEIPDPVEAVARDLVGFGAAFGIGPTVRARLAGAAAADASRAFST